MEKPANVKKSKIIRKSKILVNRELRAYYESIFKCCDKNNDGFVSICELKDFLQNEEHADIPDDVVECIVNKFDKNSDTQLDFEEFLEMINNKTFIETFQNIKNRILRFIVFPHTDKAHPCLKKTITATGAYEEQLKFGWNTIGILIISVLQVILFYADWKYEILGPIGEALSFQPCDKIKIYRYISYMLVHSSQMHLYGNIIIQTILGIPLEMVHSWRVTVIYIVGAFGGSLVHSVFDRTSELVGGSGGGSALYTAHIAVVIMNWREMSHPAVHLILFALIVIVDVFVNLFVNQMEHISYLCHAGGAIAGLLIGNNIVRNLRVTKREYIMKLICTVGLTAFFITFLIADWTISTRGLHCESFFNYLPILKNLTSDNN